MRLQAVQGRALSLYLGLNLVEVLAGEDRLLAPRLDAATHLRQGRLSFAEPTLLLIKLALLFIEIASQRIENGRLLFQFAFDRIQIHLRLLQPDPGLGLQTLFFLDFSFEFQKPVPQTLDLLLFRPPRLLQPGDFDT